MFVCGGECVLCVECVTNLYRSLLLLDVSDFERADLPERLNVRTAAGHCFSAEVDDAFCALQFNDCWNVFLNELGGDVFDLLG